MTIKNKIIMPKSGAAKFLFSVANPEDLPDIQYKEISFFGSSNVGKSSLINALCRQKNLAKTSKTPGRTQLLNFFAVPPKTILVDVPGYGYAHIPEKIRQTWQDLLLGYLESRSQKLKAYLLFDCRRFIREQDMEIVRLFQEYSIDFTFVGTKIDKLNKTEHEKFLNKIKEQFGNACRIIITSAKNKSGIDDLKNDIET